MVLFGAVVVTTGCSGFERAWKETASVAPGSDPVVGCWQGRWYSETANHGDKLRCVIMRRDDGTYDAWFRACFMKMMAGEYHAKLVTTDHETHVQVQAKADLGALAGGIYHQKGRIQSGRYVTRYWSKKDRGTLTMQRLVP